MPQEIKKDKSKTDHITEILKKYPEIDVMTLNSIQSILKDFIRTWKQSPLPPDPEPLMESLKILLL